MIKGMRPKGPQLTSLYKSVSSQYETAIDVKWKWQAGEKKRVLQSFIRFCESMKVRDRELLEEMMSGFGSYVEKQSKLWSKWDKATRENYLGFVMKTESIAIYVAKTVRDDSAEELEIEGTKTNDEWDF